MIQRTGNNKIAVVGWGRGMGHKGHMYLASSVISQAQKMKADPYFFVSKTVGKDDPIFPEEKVKIYQKVFPQQAPIFQPQGNLNQALTELAEQGYQGVVLVVGADQKQAFQYLERPNKEGVPVFQSMGLQKLRVISRQETGDSSAELEGPRATPMREVLLHPEASEEQKFEIWRDAMPDALGDKEVMDLMKKAEARLMGSRVKKTKVAESRIMDRDAKVNVAYIGPSGKKLQIATDIPHYLISKLIAKIRSKGFDISADNIEVSPTDYQQYRRTSQPELAEGVQAGPNEVAELLYKVKPELFSRFGDDFVMDAITQACEQHQGSAQEVAHKVVGILKQGISEAYDHNAPFNAEDFRRHMKDLEAREQLRKTDPVSAKALDLRGQLPQQSKKKPDDDSMSTSDPRHPQYAYTQAGHHNVDEGAEEALQYATQAHAGQTRSGGDPYITHPMRVADHIRKYKQSHNLDALISAAYLHDTIEDTDTTQEALHDLFGGLVASLVKELTSDPEQIKKMGKAAYLSHKMAAMSSYGLVIKLADRLDNVKDITTAKTPEWRQKYAKETNQILDYIEKTRALSGTHNKLISLIRAKLAEIDNPEQGVAEGSSGDELNARPGMWRGDAKRMTSKGKPTQDELGMQDNLKNRIKSSNKKGGLTGPKGVLPEEQGVAEGEGISRRGILKGIAGAGALGAAGKASAIAGAFPTPSHQQAMYAAAAQSSRAQAAELQRQNNAARAAKLDVGTKDVERLNKVNYHGGKVTPTDAEWDGDSDFLDMDGTKYNMAARMPISGDEPSDMKLISTREGRQVYIWTRRSLKGTHGRYFYPASVNEAQLDEFAPGNGDDDGLPNAEYEVYQCSLDDQFDWIGKPLMQTDQLDKAHGYAYKLWQKHPDKCFMIWQEKSQGSRGGYGPVGSVLAPSEDDITENSDYLDEK